MRALSGCVAVLLAASAAAATSSEPVRPLPQAAETIPPLVVVHEPADPSAGVADVAAWEQVSWDAERTRRYLAAVDAARRAERAAALERARQLAARADRSRRSSGDGCGGWRDLVLRWFGEGSVNRACAVLLCESGGNPNAIGPVQRDGSPRPVGLMQVKGGSTDPEANMRQAAAMHDDRGWQPWAC